MKRMELLTRILITTAVLGTVGTPFLLWARTPLIHARIAENGGWNPDVLQAKVGQPLHLHLTSDDVMHSFAVGQMDMRPVDVEPGKVADLTLIFDKTGTYTFYCTRWCGLNHWRMRGTIEVDGPAPDPLSAAASPLYVTLGLNLDASHNSPIVPSHKPSVISGQQLSSSLIISQFINPSFYRTHSPYQAWQNLRANSSLSNLDDQQIWDLVAIIWQSNTTSEMLESGQQLFAQNCAACHGERGAGDGVFADQLSAAGKIAMQTMAGTQNMTMQRPANFTDPKRMLDASPALLQGKILRGGMGTGMPSWGPIFTQEQIWDVIAYIYSFQFEGH